MSTHYGSSSAGKPNTQMLAGRNKSVTEGSRGVIFGGLTGSFEITITYPIKYVKTQLQLEEKFGQAKQYSGLFDCMNKTVQQHGVLGLYRGFNILLYGPKAAIRFGAFETLKAHFQDDSSGVLAPHYRFLCGVGSGIVEAVLLNTPLETIEVKLINDQRTGRPRFRGFFHGASTIYREEGFKGIYQGMSASVIKQASNQGIRFFVMETSKNVYTNGDPSMPVPKVVVGVFGGFAGFCSVMGNNPVDVVKTRMQGLESKKYRNTLDCFLTILKKEGMYSFYRGITPRLFRVCLEVSLTFLIYDTLKDLFGQEVR